MSERNHVLKLIIRNSPINMCQKPEVLDQARDRRWLVKVSDTLNQYWQKENAAKRDCSGAVSVVLNS
jgi:hypothetical protein